MDFPRTPGETAEVEFLKMIDRDLVEHPDRAVFATIALANYLAELTSGSEVDYDAAIEGDYRI
jgi:hypothetical protein